MSRRWCTDPFMMPDYDDDGRKLSKQDVYDIKEQYEALSSAKLVMLHGKESMGSARSAIMEDVLFERGLDPWGEPLDSFSRDLYSGR